MKLDRFNSVRKSGRSIDINNITESSTVQIVAKLKVLLAKKSSMRYQQTPYRRVLPTIRIVSTETIYSLQ